MSENEARILPDYLRKILTGRRSGKLDILLLTDCQEVYIVRNKEELYA
jgi:hypothetical protein